MMTPKGIFLKKKELCENWSAVANADWFAEVLTHARAVFMDMRPTAEEMRGAMAFEMTLRDLCEDEAPAPVFPQTGLRHDLDNPKPNVKPEPDK